MPQIFTVAPADARARLDKFLLAQLGAASRTQVQKLIRAGAVTVNGKPCSVHHFLKAGDVVAVDDRGSRKQGAGSTKFEGSMKHEVRSMEWLRPADPHTSYSLLHTPTILYEDDSLLVLDKPSGLLVHPTDKNESNTLVAWLLAHHPAIAGVGDDPRRPGIVHRLDRDVSGLMVVAKTPAAFAHLKQQFQQRTVGKDYLALAYGHFAQPEGVVKLPIGRSRRGKFVAHPTVDGVTFAHDDRSATTRYRVVRAVGPHSLLAVTIDTGRSHQIRAHLSAIGHPIVGDPLYRPRKTFLRFFSRRVKVDRTLGRPFLHAQGLRFTAPNGTPLAFTSPLPTDLQAYLDARP